MTSEAVRLIDFNLDEGAPLVAMTKPLAFVPAQADEVCEACQSAKTKLATLETKYEEDLATQVKGIEARFESEIQTLKEDLDAKLRMGLDQCLTALFPHLSEASLRKALQAEIRESLMDSLPGQLSVRISPECSGIIDVPFDVSMTQDPDLSGYSVEIRQGDARTRLDPEVILNNCLAFLKPEPSNETPK